MVVVTFKTIDLKSFHLDIPDTEKIADVKKKIAETQGYEVEYQKLIYCGKILDDSQTLADLKLDLKKFIVVMTTKKPVAPAEGVETTVPEEQGFVSGGQGIVSGARHGMIPRNHGVAVGGQGAYITGVHGQQQPFDFNAIVSHPGFAALQEMYFVDPDNVVELVSQFVDSEEMANAIRASPNQFLYMLQNSRLGQIPPAQTTLPTLPGPFVQGIAQPQGFHVVRHPQVAHVPLPVPLEQTPAQDLSSTFTADDRQAIQRMLAMGFQEPLVYEAYLVCEKNEAMAIDYILRQMKK